MKYIIIIEEQFVKKWDVIVASATKSPMITEGCKRNRPKMTLRNYFMSGNLKVHRTEDIYKHCSNIQTLKGTWKGKVARTKRGRWRQKCCHTHSPISPGVLIQGTPISPRVLIQDPPHPPADTVTRNPELWFGHIVWAAQESFLRL